MGGEEPAPVEAGSDEDDREQDGNDMPDEPPAGEAANEVAGQRHQKLFHVNVAGECQREFDVQRLMLNVRCFLLELADKLSALQSNRLLARTIHAGAVQINQDVARLGTLAGADDAPVLQFVHDARGSGVAEAQPALQQ